MLIFARLTLQSAAFALTILSAAPGTAQTYAWQCAEPIPPTVPQSAELQVEFRKEIEDDFQRYFSAVTDYSNCLAAAQATAYDDAKTGWLAYRSFRDQVGDPTPGNATRHQSAP